MTLRVFGTVLRYVAIVFASVAAIVLVFALAGAATTGDVEGGALIGFLGAGFSWSGWALGGRFP